jgi:16S rRNA (guanine527-N7)-methyltransferase
MNQLPINERLGAGLAAMGLEIAADRQVRLLEYLALLQKWNKTYNLTAIHEPERMLTHHLLDSLVILPHVTADRLLDVGAGAGLPGIPLAIARPELAVTLIDASHKKAAFMQQAAIELKLTNVTALHGRVEDLDPATKYPQIVSRAFSELNEFVRLTAPLLADRGEWLAMKGLYPNEEIAQLKGARVKRDVELRVPGLDADRRLIVIEAAA